MDLKRFYRVDLSNIIRNVGHITGGSYPLIYLRIQRLRKKML